jgi:TolB-like protein
MKGPGDLFGPLHKRHIVQVGIAYLAVGWFFVQAVGFFTEQYELSRRLLNVSILLALLGFPAAMVIAWFHGERGHQRLQKSEVIILTTLAVLAAIGTYQLGVADEPFIGGDVADEAPDLGEGSVAVLPFTNSTGADSLDWLGPGLSDMLTTSLAQLPELRVVSPQRLFDLLHEEGRQETEQIPQDVAIHIVGRSGARAMVRGSIVGSGDALTVDAQLIDIQDGTVLGAERARGTDVFALVDSVASKLSQRLQGVMDVPPAEITPIGEVAGNLEAYRAYVDGLRAKWELLQPDDVEGRYWLESMYEMMPGRENDRRHVLEEIVAIDPTSARAYGSLAELAIRRGDLTGADSLISRYLELDPGAASAHELQGQLFELTGRLSNARKAYRQALQLQPDNVLALDHLVRSSLQDDRVELAREELQPFLVAENADIQVEARLLMGDTYAWAGELDTALDYYRDATALAEALGRQDLRARSLESVVSLASNIGRSEDAVEGMTFRPFGVPSMVERAVALLDFDRTAKAAAILASAESEFVQGADRLFPLDHYTLMYGQARYEEAIGNRGKATRAYQKLMDAWRDAIERVPLVSDTPERLAELGR